MLFLSSADFFKVFKKFFQEFITRVSSGLHPEQAWQNVWPDLGHICLQRWSVDDKSCHLSRNTAWFLIKYLILNIVCNRCRLRSAADAIWICSKLCLIWPDTFSSWVQWCNFINIIMVHFSNEKQCRSCWARASWLESTLFIRKDDILEKDE